MLKNIPWLDRFGFVALLCLVFAVTFFWWTGGVGLSALLIAIAVTLLFAFIVTWAANRYDDDPDNDSASDALEEMKTEARSRWSALTEGGDASKQ
jgi:high-affinity Fe2+/Pb2+ permease